MARSITLHAASAITASAPAEKSIIRHAVSLPSPVPASGFELAPGNRLDVDLVFDRSSAAPLEIWEPTPEPPRAPSGETWFRDTVLIPPREQINIGLVPHRHRHLGDALLHLEHAEAGMMTTIACRAERGRCCAALRATASDS